MHKLGTSKFHILNLNPCYDHWVVLEDEPKIPEVVRGDRSLKVVDGKGLNIARVFETLEERNYNTVNITGGNVGELIKKETEAAGLNATYVDISENNRINTAVVHEYKQEMQMVNEPGPKLKPGEIRGINDFLVDYLDANGGTLVISGSAPRGYGPEDFAEIVAYAQDIGYRVEMDISKRWLERLIDSKPDVLKINFDEFELAFGSDPADGVAVEGFRRDKGIETLILTDGRRGSYALAGGKLYRARPGEVYNNFNVGSGDSYFGGWLYAEARGQDLPERMRTATACGVANTLNYGPAFFSYEEFSRELDKVILTEGEI